jgi:hypothetical protein
MTHEQLIEALLALCGIGLLQGQVIWRLVRERNYSRELCLREQQRNISRENELLRKSVEMQNETLRVVLTAFASAQPVTLDDLLTQAERDWSLRPSRTPSEG